MNTERDLSKFKALVIGAGRGGTSLLAALLDSHSHIECGMEIGGIPYLVGEEIETRSNDIFGERVNAFLDICMEYSSQCSKAIWCNKITTEQVCALEDHNAVSANKPIDVLDEFFNRYLSRIKVIFILRDGRTCVRSKVERTGQPVSQAIARWKYSVSVARFLKSRHRWHNLIIKYEDLITTPTESLKTICDFMGVPYEENMRKGTLNKKLRPEYMNDGFVKSKLNLQGVPDGCEEQIMSELKELGYT